MKSFKLGLPSLFGSRKSCEPPAVQSSSDKEEALARNPTLPAGGKEMDPRVVDMEVEEVQKKTNDYIETEDCQDKVQNEDKSINGSFLHGQFQHDSCCPHSPAVLHPSC